MWTRNILILACCLASSCALAAQGSAPGYAEVVTTPDPSAQDMYAPVPDDMPSGMSCDTPYPPRPTPLYYWWLPYHGRGQHYAYLPPLPGWYYFRPYGPMQLRMQQKAVADWGGDPRFPYDNSFFQQIYPKVDNRSIPTPK